VKTPLKVLLRAALVALALAAALLRPAGAGAAAPCWKALLNDWYDGRIDHTYALHCYQDALDHLPADVQTYSSAHDDILRALQSARSKATKGGKKVGPNTPLPAPGGTNGGTNGGTTTSEGPTGTDHGGGTTTSVPGRKPDKGIGGLADKLNPSSADSLPVPLLILGGLALLLVAAGAAGVVAKRIQARKQAP